MPVQDLEPHLEWSVSRALECVAERLYEKRTWKTSGDLFWPKLTNTMLMFFGKHSENRAGAIPDPLIKGTFLPFVN